MMLCFALLCFASKRAGMCARIKAAYHTSNNELFVVVFVVVVVVACAYA